MENKLKKFENLKNLDAMLNQKQKEAIETRARAKSSQEQLNELTGPELV